MDINQKDKDGLTPLINAIQDNNFLNVKMLIEEGADVNITDNSGFSPLMIACLAPDHTKDNLDIIKLLLNSGADKSIRCSGYSAKNIVDPKSPKDYNRNPWPEAYDLLQDPNGINTKTLGDNISIKINEYIDSLSNAKETNDPLIQEFAIFVCDNNKNLDYKLLPNRFYYKIKSYIEAYSLILKRQFYEANQYIKNHNIISVQWFKKEIDKAINNSLHLEVKISKKDIDIIIKLTNEKDIENLINFIIDKNFNDDQITRIKDLLSSQQGYSLVEKIHLVKLVKQYHFNEANKYFTRYNSRLNISEYKDLLAKFLSQYFLDNNINFSEADENRIIDSIVYKENIDMLAKIFAEYDIYPDNFDKISPLYSKGFYDKLKDEVSFYFSLKQYDFKNADLLLDRLPKNKKESFLKDKAQYVKKYLESIGQKCDDEQSQAIANMCQNILLKARAGSGKTTTIINKSLFEIKKYSLKPEELRILAFNKDAADNVVNKLSELNITSNRIATTFHSLAREIYLSYKDLKNIEILANTKKVKIHELIDTELLPDKTIDDLYTDIRNSCFTIQGQGDYYGSLLMDDTELPLLQKYMADFLFEHHLEYENALVDNVKLDGYLFYDRKSYHADFQCRASNKNIYIRVMADNSDSYQQAFRQKHKKVGDILLEFYCPLDIEAIANAYLERNTEKYETLRKDFEDNFKSFLESNGFTTTQLKERDTRLSQFLKNYKNNFHELCEDIIENYQQKQWNIAEIIHRVQKFEEKHINNQYIHVLKISIEVYKKYNQYLKENELEDFNTLMAKSYEYLKKLNTLKTLSISQSKLKRKIKIWKLLCIDEFQDFSQLFFNLIYAIKQINPDIRLFCVGDDWQAINGFAGADRVFFNYYEEKIKNEFKQDATVLMLRTNRRSRREIIEVSNYFMTDDPNTSKGGIPTDSEKNKEYDNSALYYMQGNYKNRSVFLNFIKQQNIPDKNCIYSDLLFQIMNENNTEEFNYLILARRTKSIEKVKEAYEPFIGEMEAKAGIDLSDSYEQSKFLTVHKSKGLESDIVIILVENNSFPLYNPTSQVKQELFGIDWYNEEKNLFYVALTRAKKQVYFVDIEGYKTSNYFSDKIIKTTYTKTKTFNKWA